MQDDQGAPSHVRLPTFTIGVSTPASVAQVAAAVGPALHVTFAERDSSYYGGTYFLAKLWPEEIRIYRNWDLYDQGPVYEDAREYAVLVEFRQSQRPREDVQRELSDALHVVCRVVRPKG